MADAKEIPELAGELLDLSKEYLRQETLEPAKRLGRVAGFRMAAGALFGFGSLFLVLAAYTGLEALLPAGEWWVVLARGLTVLIAAAACGLIAWRLSSGRTR